MELSQSEQVIIEQLRTLKPFERIEIVADKLGKPDAMLMHRSSKFVLDSGVVLFVK